MLQKLARLLLPVSGKTEARSLYLALVGQSRNPFFYAELGVPDTLDGRFELILLHVFLVLYRLKAGHGGSFSDKAETFERQLIEILFEDMDRSLREIGVGDLGVAKRIKKMANALYGRLHAYDETIGDPARLEAALTRNLYGTTEARAEWLEAMGTYIETAGRMLFAQSVETIESGEVRFPQPVRVSENQAIDIESSAQEAL